MSLHSFIFSGRPLELLWTDAAKVATGTLLDSGSARAYQRYAFDRDALTNASSSLKADSSPLLLLPGLAYAFE
jgi:hypothetical protein